MRGIGRLIGSEVTRVCFDLDQVLFLLTAADGETIEATVTNSVEVFESSAGHRVDRSRLIGLLGDEVEHVSLSLSGILTVQFSTGPTVVSRPEEAAEAWQLSGDNWRLISAPGGKVVSF